MASKEFIRNSFQLFIQANTHSLSIIPENKDALKIQRRIDSDTNYRQQVARNPSINLPYRCISSRIIIHLSRCSA